MSAILFAGLLFQAAAASPPALSLDKAVERALANQPQLAQARATTEAARARVDESFAPLLPQVTASASYSRSTFNPQFPAPPATGTTQTFDTSGRLQLGVTGSMTLYDFGQTRGRWHVAEASLASQEATEQASAGQLVLSVRTAYFQVRAQKALLDVARENLANQDKHLAQIQGFVELGSRPEIDLAQARADKASAEVQVIQAQNGYDTARLSLNQAMGDEGPIDYEVAEQTLASIAGEDGPIDTLLAGAYAKRPELRALMRQEEAARLSVSATRAGYAPSLGVQTGVTEGGSSPSSLAWNWNASATLTWPIYQGGLTVAQVREAEANVSGVVAQIRSLRQQIRVDVQQAQLAARAAKASLLSAEVAATNARERFRLAEARYATGVGSIIELGDAQIALSTALGQKVQADYTLASARAQLLRALGQP